jgi:hypothetical protein
VDLDHVVVVELADGLRFPFESAEHGGVTQRKDFCGNIAFQYDVPRAVHLSHPALPDQLPARY